MKRLAATALTAVVLSAGFAAPAAHAHGRGHWHGGSRIGVGIGIGFGAPLYWGGPYVAPGYYGGGTLLVAPPPVVYAEPQPVPAAPPITQPEPIFYPRNGQTGAQTEVDRRDCNRWAVTQPNAMGDASVFHRATLACMEGKGYTVR